MALNPAHLGDIVSPTVGELTGQHGTIIALRLRDNHCQVRFAPLDDPNDSTDHQFAGNEIILIECKHQGVITGEQQSDT